MDTHFMLDSHILHVQAYLWCKGGDLHTRQYVMYRM